tara:strand:- start:532 stop:741 length:210 start_codon:yes stop_codon:yes gene_type:complete
MSDSVKKYFELVEEGKIKDALRPNDYLSWKLDSLMDNDKVTKEAYTILTKYNEAAILKAADILKKPKKD